MLSSCVHVRHHFVFFFCSGKYGVETLLELNCSCWSWSADCWHGGTIYWLCAWSTPETKVCLTCNWLLYFCSWEQEIKEIWVYSNIFYLSMCYCIVFFHIFFVFSSCKCPSSIYNVVLYTLVCLEIHTAHHFSKPETSSNTTLMRFVESFEAHTVLDLAICLFSKLQTLPNNSSDVLLL